jgi:Flp pilus assembly protein TadB
MDNNIDFKDLWKKQTVSQPNIDELLSKLKQFKRGSLKKLILTNILLIATSAFIVFIWYHYQPEYISTKIGIILTVLAMAMYLFVYNKLAMFYKSIDSTQSNNDYLQKLISIKTKQQFLQSTILSLYFILLGTGLCLYMYEYTLKMSLFWGIFTYVIMLFWIGIVWFYLRPKEIKKQNTKINNLISRFEEINNQLKRNL